MPQKSSDSGSISFLYLIIGTVGGAFLLSIALYLYFYGSPFNLQSRKSFTELLKGGDVKEGLSRVRSLPAHERNRAENLLWFGKFAYFATWEEYDSRGWVSYGEREDDWFTSSILDEGIAALTAASQIPETSEEATFFLALISMEKGHYREAERYFQRVLRDNPSHRESLLNYAVLHTRFLMFDRAEKLFLKGHQLYPDDAEFIKNIFWLYAVYMVNYEKALHFGDLFTRKFMGQRSEIPPIVREMRDILERFPEYDRSDLYIRENEPPRFTPRASAVRMRDRQRRSNE